MPGSSGYPEPTEIEMMVDAGHVATLEAAILVLTSRYVGLGASDSDRERWDHALAKARHELARWRRRPAARKIILD